MFDKVLDNIILNISVIFTYFQNLTSAYLILVQIMPIAWMELIAIFAFALRVTQESIVNQVSN